MKSKKIQNLPIIPSLSGVFLFFFLPLCLLVGRVFWSSQTHEFVGFANFQVLFKNEAFQLASKNTIGFVLFGIGGLVITSLLFSILLRGQFGIFQKFKIWYVLPLAIPSASLSIFWKFFFYPQGILNGFFHTKIDWLDTSLSFWVIVCIYIWKNFGYMVILWLAGMNNIAYEYIEAARMDGASERRIFLKIILPNLKPTIFVVYLLAMINSFKIFRDIYAIAGDYPQENMYLLQHLFNNWFRNFELDKMATGAFVYLIALLLLLFPVQNYLEKV